MRYEVSGIFIIEVRSENELEARIKAQQALNRGKLTWANIITVEEAKE